MDTAGAAGARDDVRVFLEHALRLTRAEPDAPPAPHLVAWQRHLAAAVGVLPRHARTNRELLDGALRLQRMVRGLPDPVVASPPYDARRAQAALAAAVPYPLPSWTTAGAPGPGAQRRGDDEWRPTDAPR